MPNINIKRAVDNIRSGATTIYTPVVEVIVNAIQAIHDKKIENGLVHVSIIRSKQTEMLDKIAAVEGFEVSDNGIGFTEAHRDSFDTLYSARKADVGGKGFGRFTCLKYFEKFQVQSVFVESGTHKRRSFIMGAVNDIIVDEKLEDIDKTQTGSVVTISGIKNAKFPDKGLDVIARILVEKLLPYFIDTNKICPKIVIRDRSTDTPIVLNDYLSSSTRQIVELHAPNQEIRFPSPDGDKIFNVRIFKCYAPRTNKSKISLVAHQREVSETTIQTFIPEFSDEFYDKSLPGESGTDRNYIVKTYVLGIYLDDNVSLERGAFNFHKDNDLVFGISQSQIEGAAAKLTQEAVGEEVTARRERKLTRIRDYVDTKAPWHRSLSERADFSSLPINPTPQEIELHLQTEKFQLETKARAAVQKILSDESSDPLSDRVTEVIESISQTSKNDLIHYVSMRKCVLDLFGRSLEIDENGKYKSEGDVHDIIMPRHKDSDEINYEQHNLWILDERLNFAGYISSDKSLDGKRGDRTDVNVFGRRIAFRGDNEPSNPIIIFEFKKPDRHNFVDPSADEDPIEQIIRYVNDIHDGKYKNVKGREIRTTNNTPFYGYVICDLNPKVRKWLERIKNFTSMPDGLGYFQWIGNLNLYVEVLSWEKVKNDAEMRNRIFFHKLGID